MARSFLAIACMTLAASACAWVQKKTKKDDDEEFPEKEAGSTTVIQNITIRQVQETTVQNNITVMCPVPRGPSAVTAPVQSANTKIAVRKNIQEDRKRRRTVEKASEAIRASNEEYRISLRKLKDQDDELCRIAAVREEEERALERAYEEELHAALAEEQEYLAVVAACTAQIQEIKTMVNYYEEAIKEIKELADKNVTDDRQIIPLPAKI